MRGARLFCAFFAMVSASAAAARNFQPPILWSASGGDVAESEPILGTSLIANAGDDAVVWVGGESQPGNLALRALMRPGQPPVYDQFGDDDTAHGFTIQRILDASSEVALLRVREANATQDFRRETLAAIDLVGGGLRWAVPIAADRAKLLAGGDTLVQTASHLLRLSPDGSTRWVRALDDVVDPRETAEPARLQVAGDHVVVELNRYPFVLGGPAALPRRLQAFALGDGAPAWRIDLATPELRSCGTGAVGGAFVVALRDEFSTQGTTTVTLERRASLDGSLLGRTVLNDVPGDDTSCQVVDVDGTTVLATLDDVGEGVLAGIAADGSLRWRSPTLQAYGVSVVRIPGSTDFVYLGSPPGTSDDVIRRQRSSDGSQVWEVTRTRTGNLGVRRGVATAQGLQVVFGDVDGVTATHFSLADGAVLSSGELAPMRRRLLPYVAAFIDGAPFDAAVAADGGIRVQRRAPVVGTELPWARDEPGFPAASLQPVSVQFGTAGATRLLVVARYQYPVAAEQRSALVVLALDRATGALLWRRDLGDHANFVPALMNAADGGLLVRTYPCPAIGACGSTPTVLERWSAADGSTAWSRSLQPSVVALAGADALVYSVDAPNALSWRRLDAAAGTDLWVQPLASVGTVFDLELPSSGGFLASISRTLAGVPTVDVERRSLSDGALQWSLRAGGAGDRVAGPVMRRAVNGFPLLTARLSRSDAGQEGLVRPLLQLVDDTNGSAPLTVQPPLQGDRFWTLRPVAGSGASIVRQPLRSLRLLESLDQPYNSRVALATLDLGTGVPGGEQLIERRFDDPLLGETAVELLQVLADGSLLAADLRLGADGLRRRALLRLGAPADGGGDLVVRLVDGTPPVAGMGPSRRVEVEIENVGGTPATDAVFGVAWRRDRDPAFAVLSGCSVVTGSATCPADAASRRVSLGAGARVRLAFEVFDPAYVGRPPQTQPGLAGVRIFVDAPWGYADAEPGNNVVEASFRLASFADDFE